MMNALITILALHGLFYTQALGASVGTSDVQNGLTSPIADLASYDLNNFTLQFLNGEQKEVFIFCRNGSMIQYACTETEYRMRHMSLRQLDEATNSAINRHVPLQQEMDMSQRYTELRKHVEESLETPTVDLKNFSLESSDGRQIIGEVLSRTDDSIEFKMSSDGRIFTIPFERLSQESVQDILNRVPSHFLYLSEYALTNKHHGEERNAIHDIAYALGIAQPHTITVREKTRITSRSGLHAVSETKTIYEIDKRGDFLIPTEYSVDQAGEIGEPVSIYDDITYLMPISEVTDMLRDMTEMPDRQEIICPGFPDRAFKLYLFPVSTKYRQENGIDDSEKLSGYNSIGVATDTEGQVVAVQLNRTTSVAVYSKLVSTRRHTAHYLFNFLETKKKAQRDAQVLIESEWQRTNNGSIRSYYINGVTIPIPPTGNQQQVQLIETLFLSDENFPENYSRLYLPEKMANLLRYNILNNWVRPEDLPKVETTKDNDSQR